MEGQVSPAFVCAIELHFRRPSAKLHCPLLPPTRKSQPQTACRLSHQQFVANSGWKTGVNFEVHGKASTVFHDGEGKEWHTQLLTVRRHDAIISAEVTSRNAVQFKLKLLYHMRCLRT